MQDHLAAADFACRALLAGPDRVAGQAVTAGRACPVAISYLGHGCAVRSPP
jgi:hypothetical protein